MPRIKLSERARTLRYNHGMSLEDYDKMLAAQGGKCAICGVVSENRNLCVDHNHATSKIRGLLCVRCNTGIGSLREDITRFYKAIAYLEAHCETLPS